MTIPKIKEIEDIARLARLNLEKDGFLAQTAFLWKGDSIAIMGGRPIETKVDKAAWGAVVRRWAVELEADTVLTIMECWAAERKGPLAPDDMKGPISEMAGAYEGVMFHLETMDGTWGCIVRIVKSEGQGPMFPMPRHWTQGHTEGLLTNFLPDKKASAYSRGDE
jgi:hypothetical protein